MQLEEGPEEAVQKVARTIYADLRHSGIIQLLERKSSQREFPDWPMDFKTSALHGCNRLAEFMESNP